METWCQIDEGFLPSSYILLSVGFIQVIGDEVQYTGDNCYKASWYEALGIKLHLQGYGWVLKKSYSDK